MNRPDLFRRSLLTIGAIALATIAPGRFAYAGCNLIPPAERLFSSTLGAVLSPITIPGRTVEIRLGPCDASLGFDPVAGNNTVKLTFQPPAGASTAVPIASFALANCSGDRCDTLTFVVPDTTGILPPDGLAGPAKVTVVRGVTTVAEIDQLSAPRPSATACTGEPETIFEQFTVLPAPNDFYDLANGAPQVLATLDGGGNLIIPFDYVAVLPLGPGEPVARLVSGFATIDAFTSSPGVPIVLPDTTYARSFTVDGRPLPPLLRASAAGDSVFGTTDAAQAILRIARTDGEGGPPIFDLSDRFSNAGRGPIVITTFSAVSGEPIPLANLRSSETSVAFTRDESLAAEGNLNAASGDTDENDRIVQILDPATGASTNTAMAVSDPHSPIFGEAALTTAEGMVAFFESEVDQNGTDLNGDGDALDHVLRVFDVTGTEITPGPTLVGDPFTVINRQPLAISGSLVFYREPMPGVSLAGYDFSGSVGVGTEGSIVTSPDGRFVFVTAQNFGAVLVLGYRDPETGVYGFTDAMADDQLGFSGMAGASGMAVSPDSRFLYIAGSADNAIQAASIWPRVKTQFGGNVSHPFEPVVNATDVEVDGAGGVDGLAGVSRLAISPDGDHLYAAGTGEDALAVFSRDSSTGALTYVEAQINLQAGVSGLDEPRGVAVSPDGKNVYVAARASSAVTAFARNVMTGALTFLATYGDGGLGGPSLAGAREVAVSADGLNVYVAADTDSAVSVFSRNTLTGALTFVEAKVDGVGGVSGIGQAQAVAITPDGQTLYAGGAGSSFAVFRRVMPGGALTFVEAEVTYNDFARGIAVSPDSQNVYVLTQYALPPFPNYVVPFQRNGRLRAFDTATAMLRAGLGAEPVSVAAVAAGRAVFLSPEGGQGGTDQNFNGNTDDTLAYAYDAATDTVTQLAGVSAFVKSDRVALSATLLALNVDEQFQPGGADLNGNGILDRALAVLPTSALAGTPQIVAGASVSFYTGFAVTDLCAAGANEGDPCRVDGDCPGGACKGVVVFSSNESQVGDKDGDGAADDVVLAFYSAATGQVTYIPRKARDFVVGGNLVAIQGVERDFPGAEDLNGDSDTDDEVLVVYDLKTRRLINTGQALLRCELPGCAPGRPYKIIGDSVAFLTDEADQGHQDLDGNGLENVVAQVFNVRNGHRKVFGVPANAPNLPPLPDDFIDTPIVYREMRESDLGIDVNEDGDFDDVVNLIDGDNDGDGVFNEDDTCVETPDEEARDSDLDGLGDVCDTNPYCDTYTPLSPPLAPLANEKCQEALGKATRGYITARANALRGCLNDLAKGKVTGDATMVCRGSSFAGQEVAPADSKTATKLAKARAKLNGAIAGNCSVGDLGALDPCATSVAGLQTCLAERITSGVDAVFALAYGDVARITDKAPLKCQTAIGGAALGYVKAAASAMIGCLDERNKGDVIGDGQVLCLGAATIAGVTAPAEPGTQMKLTKAEEKVQNALATKCAGALLAGLDACGTTPAAVKNCLVCTGWRRAVEAVRGAYGVP